MVARPRRNRIARIAGVVVLIAALAYVIAALLARPAGSLPWFASRPEDHKPLVMAHQGGENIRPSNTMEAFRHAVEIGADVLDTDMHITKDGALVLMHDTTVDRTTNGTGAIVDLTLEQIKQLDAGYRFTADDGETFPYRGKDLTVPTLEEVFAAFPDKRFGIEIKQAPISVAQRFCDDVRQYGMQDKVLVSSFGQPNMTAFRRACPEVATSATQDEVLRFLIITVLRLTPTYSPPYQSLQIPESSSGIRLLTPRFIRAAHSRGLAVQPWTINEDADLRRVVALGVDAINTDNPDRLLEILK